MRNHLETQVQDSVKEMQHAIHYIGYAILIALFAGCSGNKNKLTVTSKEADDKVIDYKEKEEDNCSIVSAAKLAKLYPQKTILTFAVDKNGKITIQ